MTDWQEKKLGMFLTQRKERVIINPDIEYSLVTISNKGTIKLREKKKGAVISAKKGYIAKAGDFIYSRLSVHTGAFGIVPIELNNALITNEMPCFKIDENQILPKVLIDLIGLPDFLWQLKQLAKGMGRVRIKESMMISLSLVLPPLAEQIKLARKIDRIKKNHSVVTSELAQQQTLLKNLCQQILQDAIEGKLTQDWREKNPNVEPARELLKRIQVEKEQLIKDKKIKKQKPLPPISEEEKQFELPEGWAWSRLREFSTHYVDCPHDTPKYQATGFLCLRAPDITEKGLRINTVRRVSNDEYEKRIRRLKPVKHDLVYIREGGRLGIAGLIDTNEPVCLGQRVMILRFSDEGSAKYSLRFLNAPNTYNDIVGKTFGSASPHVNVRDILSHVAPVPPLPEQKEIVKKVEKLFTLCDQLEEQITSSQTNAEQLMQSVLKEAFSQDEKVA